MLHTHRQTDEHTYTHNYINRWFRRSGGIKVKTPEKMLSIFACVCIVGPMQGTSKWLSINSCLFITNPNRITHLLNTPSLRWLILLKHTCYYVILQQLFIKIDQPAFLVFFELVLITKVPWFFIFTYSLPKKMERQSTDMVPLGRDGFFKDPFFSSSWEEFDQERNQRMASSKNSFWEKVTTKLSKHKEV